MIKEALINIGLTDGEIRVYLALLELGSTTAGPVIEKSRISSSKIYDVLLRLVRKGLAGYILKGDVKHFQAANPHRLLDFLKNKEAEIQKQEADIRKILPQLEQKIKLIGEREEAEILMGVRGIKTFFELIMREFKKGAVYYCLGYPKESSKRFHAFFVDYHKRRIRTGCTMRIIYNNDAWYWKKREPRALTYARVLPREIMTPAYINIYKDTIGTVVLGENPLCFMIKNQIVADSYIQYFEMLWKQASEPETLRL